MNKNIIITIILLIVVGGGVFYGGMQYQKSMRSASFGQFAGQGGQGGYGGGAGRRFGQGGGQNGSAVRGKVTSVSGDNITVQEQDGSSKIILFSNSTNISKAATGSASDLTAGTQIMAAGTNNSDGSVTAQFIQINPMMRPGGRPSGKPQQ